MNVTLFTNKAEFSSISPCINGTVLIFHSYLPTTPLSHSSYFPILGRIFSIFCLGSFSFHIVVRKITQNHKQDQVTPSVNPLLFFINQRYTTCPLILGDIIGLPGRHSDLRLHKSLVFPRRLLVLLSHSLALIILHKSN